MNHLSAAPRVPALVLTIALCVAGVGGCAGSTTVRRASPSTPSPTSPTSPSPRPGAGGGDAASATTWAKSPDPSEAAPMDAAACAAAIKLYADLVAVPLGLDDDPDPADRQAVVADTARLRQLVPAGVASDLAVAAQAFGAQAQALGAGRPDQAEAAMAAPGVAAAIADLDHRLNRGCT